MLEVGRHIDRYTLEAPIGAGGQGFVYRVWHAQLGTDHALKVVTGAGRRVRDRLLQEGRAQARLRHPNIVSVTDVIEVDGDPGLIMEFVAGPPLSLLIEREMLSFDQIDLLVIARAVSSAGMSGSGTRTGMVWWMSTSPSARTGCRTKS